METLAVIGNFDLFSVGLTIAAIATLGFVVFFDNWRSITNQTFLFFTGITICWGVVNYLSYRVDSPFWILETLRLVIFFGVWHAFSFFQLFYIFPHDRVRFPGWYKFGLIPLVVGASLINLTPLSFSRISNLSASGSVSTVDKGPGLLLFILIVCFLIIGGSALLIKKMRRASGLEKTQLKFITAGVTLTFSLLFTFNFFLPAVFDEVNLIPFGAVFILPFIAFTAYAIVKHHLLNVKVVTTEILTFVLAVVSLFEVVLARDTSLIIFRMSVFVLVLSFGILLIRSVLREVKQREELQVLSQKLAEANVELKKLDASKSEFISIASHQLRAPLTVIRGYVSLILEHTLGKVDNAGREALDKVYTSTTQLVKLVSDLLDLSRIESGKIRYQFAENDFPAVVGEVVREFEEQARGKKLNLLFENRAQDLEPFLFDKDKMREVVVNFLHNAIKYSSGPGSIEILIEAKKDYEGERVRYSVKDHGMGMNTEEKKKLFVKFSRSEEARRVDPGGMGLGLYLVKRVVEDHQGTVGVESDGPGKGSTFWAEIPMRR